MKELVLSLSACLNSYYLINPFFKIQILITSWNVRLLFTLTLKGISGAMRTNAYLFSFNIAINVHTPNMSLILFKHSQRHFHFWYVIDIKIMSLSLKELRCNRQEATVVCLEKRVHCSAFVILLTSFLLKKKHRKKATFYYQFPQYHR